MSRSRTRLLNLLVVGIAAVLVLPSGCGKDEPRSEVSAFNFNGIRTSSEELAVEVEQVSGAPRDDYLEWSCLLSCREADGCHADLRVTVFYRSGGEDQDIVLTGTVNVPVGARARLTRVQRPPVPVDGVDRVEVRVTAQRDSADGPPPTPRI